jgi:hypothetical protein
MASSCSRREFEDDPAGLGGDKDGNGGSAYFAVNIRNLAGTGTRAESGEKEGNPDENAVKSILVVLYDQHNTVSYSWYYDEIDSDGTGTPAGDGILAANSATEFTLRAQRVVSQPYKLLVLVNPVADVRGLTESGDTYSELVRAVEIDADELADAGEGFFMSNHQGVVPVDVSDLKASEEEAQESPVAVMVGRAVAKVSVRQGLSFAPETEKGKAELISWGLDVTNKSTYWLRRMANTVREGVQSAEETGDPRTNLYAEDPNFERGYSRAAWRDAGGGYGLMDGELSDSFRYTSEEDIDTPISTDATWDYCLENTMAATEQWHDVTTSIIVKARWIPKTSALGTAIGETAPASGVSNPYFVYRGNIFTADELDRIAEGTIAESQLPPSVAGIRAALAEIIAVGGVFGSSAFSDFAATAPAASVVAGELSYNHDGVNYYRVPIRHFDNNIQPDVMGYGRFGVVRNNVYELTLRSIVGPGRIAIPPPDQPDEWAVGFISARLQILPWILREFLEDIGEPGYVDINPPTIP